MILNKITLGFVVQQFDTETSKFTNQEFMASDDITWERNSTVDEPIDAPNVNGEEPYMSYLMVQPSAMKTQTSF